MEWTLLYSVLMNKELNWDKFSSYITPCDPRLAIGCNCVCPYEYCYCYSLYAQGFLAWYCKKKNCVVQPVISFSRLAYIVKFVSFMVFLQQIESLFIWKYLTAFLFAECVSIFDLLFNGQYMVGMQIST